MPINTENRFKTVVVTDLFISCGVLYLAQFAAGWLTIPWFSISNVIGNETPLGSELFMYLPYYVFAAGAGAILPFALHSTRPYGWSWLLGILSAYPSALRAFAIPSTLSPGITQQMRLGTLLRAALLIAIPVISCFIASRAGSTRSVRASGA